MDFEALFQEVYPPLHRYCVRLAGDGDLADDLVQEAFFRLLDRKVQGEPEALRVWLFRVATHLLRDRFRAKETRSRLLAANPVLPWEPTRPDKAAERSEEIAVVRAALEKLDPRDREMLLLREEGFSYRELAEVVEVVPGSIGTLLARARRRFTEALAGKAGGGE